MFRNIFRVSNMLPTQLKLQYSSAAGKKLDGKVAVVTASTDGLAQDGAKIVVSSRKEANVNRTVKQLTSEGLSVHGVVCHVSKAEDRKNLFNQAVSKFGGIDILCDESSWDKIFDVNVKAAYLLSQEALPHLRKRGGGSIVYVSSIAGFQPFALLGAYSVSKTALLGLTKAAAEDCIKDNIRLLGAYSVSKTALLGLTKAAAEDCIKDNIRVNCIAPGVIKTKFSAAVIT
ncbi:hypothetical protein B566_EDAN015423 [Ephemera danica]|nr:hypothetical protein B566_EDAN015423 [Ephemera danica]